MRFKLLSSRHKITSQSNLYRPGSQKTARTSEGSINK
nr:MAG TPA: hypothetical protein [Caudoviricetes sp.]